MPDSVTITVDIWPVAASILTPKQYRVLELREQYGMSWRQIAAMTGKDQGTVRGHYYAAVKRLSEHYERSEA